MTPTVTSISTPGMVTMASTMPVTSLVQTNKQQAKVGPQSGKITICLIPFFIYIVRCEFESCSGEVYSVKHYVIVCQ
jgi:hypothetical protein